MRYCFLFILLITGYSSMHAQKVINGYAKVTGISGKSLSIKYANEVKDKFTAGSDVIIMQMQDSVMGADTLNNSAFGNLGKIANAGVYEVGTIASITRVGTVLTGVTLVNNPIHPYNTGVNGAVQVITFKNFGFKYTTAYDITCLPWDGNIGGVIAIRVGKTLTVAHNILADTMGFRGGNVSKNYQPGGCIDSIYKTASDSNGYKGEGIYKSSSRYFKNGRGHIINGGGGGGIINAGGGGGGNYTAGGQGGLGWSCTSTSVSGGFGGISLDSNINAYRVFMGGGGGGGQQNDGVGGKGARGGGIVIISADSLITPKTCTSAIRISANGHKADSSGKDGAGGGGAGGSIVLQVMKFKAFSPCPLKITANGGKGGRVNINIVHGAGGGGGQGAILFPCTLPSGNITYNTLNGKGAANSTLSGTSYSDDASGTDNAGIIYKTGFGIGLKYETKICAGDSVKLNAGDSGSAYLWNNGDTAQIITVKTAGAYSVKISLNGCVRYDTIQVNVQPLPVALLKSKSACTGDTISLSASNAGAVYVWSTGDTSQNIITTQTGEYKVNINLNGCAINDSSYVYFKPLPIKSLGPDTTLLCLGNNSITLDAGNPGARYFWNTGDTVESITPAIMPGNFLYRVLVNLNGCIGHDSIRVHVNPLKFPRIVLDTLLCPGHNIIVEVGNPLASHNWSTGSTSEMVSLSTPGKYYVKVGDNLCAIYDTITIDSIPYPRVDLGPDRTICPYYSEITLGTNFANASYLWNNGSIGPSLTTTDTGTFWLSVQNVCGKVTDTVHILLETNCCYIYLPNAFTPNHDNTNDIYRPVGFCNVSGYSFRIYNRWGQLVFESTDIKKGWDGSYQGKTQPQDVYFWYMNYKTATGVDKHLQGDVTLLR